MFAVGHTYIKHRSNATRDEIVWSHAEKTKKKTLADVASAVVLFLLLLVFPTMLRSSFAGLMEKLWSKRMIHWVDLYNARVFAFELIDSTKDSVIISNELQIILYNNRIKAKLHDVIINPGFIFFFQSRIAAEFRN